MDDHLDTIKNEIKDDLTKLVSKLVTNRDAAKSLGVVPPENIRWFVLAYLLALIGSVPNEQSSWMSMSIFFATSLTGLFAIHRFRKNILLPKKSVERMQSKIIYRIK